MDLDTILRVIARATVQTVSVRTILDPSEAAALGVQVGHQVQVRSAKLFRAGAVIQCRESRANVGDCQ